MECTLRWVGDDTMNFIAETGSGHTITLDSDPSYGGRNLAARPMEILLSGAGGCTAFDVLSILKKSGKDVRRLSVNLKAERAEQHPKVFTQIHFHFKVEGRLLKQESVEQAVSLSHQKYCSAIAMLEKTATITHSVEVISID
jgi:putative redox protein